MTFLVLCLGENITGEFILLDVGGIKFSISSIECRCKLYLLSHNSSVCAIDDLVSVNVIIIGELCLLQIKTVLASLLSFISAALELNLTCIFRAMYSYSETGSCH